MAEREEAKDPATRQRIGASVEGRRCASYTDNAAQFSIYGAVSSSTF